MKGFNFISPFLISCVILSSLSSSSSEVPANGLGIAVCDTWAQIKSTCNEDDVDVKCFPPECTSFFYGPLDLSSGTVVDSDVNKRPKDYLNSLLSLKKPVTAYISRDNWPETLTNAEKDGADKEMKSLTDFVATNKGITGFALFGVDFGLYNGDEADLKYTDKLITYIGILKKNFPQMKVGIYLQNGLIINVFYDNPKPDVTFLLDLEKLDKSGVDFFRMLAATDKDVNDCISPDLLHGEDPWNEFNQVASDHISTLKVTKDKFVWDVWAKPANVNLKECDLMYPKMCLKPNVTYCASTQQSFYKKAQFIRKIAGGFGINFLDLDDANQVCNCSRKFPVFYAVLDGFNGKPEPTQCPLLDRPNI